MPTYVYKCRDCEHRFEEAHGFHDDPVQICPECGGQVQRVIGNVGVTFKGSGFYRTDSRTAKSPSTSAKPAEKKSSKSTTDSTKSTTKAAGSTGGGSSTAS